MIDELRKWLELHAHLRDWPTLKNSKAAVEAKIQEIEARLAPQPQAPAAPPPKPRAIPAAEPETTFTSDEPTIDRRV